jgi:hypothetical protein
MDETHGANMKAQAKEISQVVQITLEKLSPLLGIWKGRGRGGYPTLEGFDYSETMRVHRERGSPFFSYEQTTELIDLEGHSIRKSHWEAGVLRPLEDGRIELACVQGSGRVEVLKGHFLPKESIPGRLSLRFESVLIGNDEKVRSTSREWSLTGDQFTYVMQMATAEVEELSWHLETTLYRENR